MTNCGVKKKYLKNIKIIIKKKSSKTTSLSVITIFNFWPAKSLRLLIKRGRRNAGRHIVRTKFYNSIESEKTGTPDDFYNGR
jgi:predicted DNA-binding protein (UPF0278 family)